MSLDWQGIENDVGRPWFPFALGRRRIEEQSHGLGVRSLQLSGDGTSELARRSAGKYSALIYGLTIPES